MLKPLSSNARLVQVGMHSGMTMTWFICSAEVPSGFKYFFLDDGPYVFYGCFELISGHVAALCSDSWMYRVRAVGEVAK